MGIGHTFQGVPHQRYEAPPAISSAIPLWNYNSCGGGSFSKAGRGAAIPVTQKIRGDISMNNSRLHIVKMVAVLFLCITFFQTTALSLDYTHEIKLKKMTFAWKLDVGKLYIKLIGATRGWVGIGFNPTHRMKDANYVLGYVKKGKVNVTDAFGVRAKEHINDTSMKGQNNITDISGSEKGKSTTIEFAIPMNSGDTADSKLSADGNTTVLLAIGRGSDNFHSRHRFRTSLKVNLSTGQYRR